MADENNVTPDVKANNAATTDSSADSVESIKGKGKAAATGGSAPAREEDDEEESEDEPEDTHDDNDEGEDDDMAEIDEDNIVAGGRRTRGKAIDFAKAAEGLDDEDLEDEDEDADFEDPDDSMQD